MTYRMEEIFFVYHKSVKELLSTIYKELLQPSDKKTTQVKCAKELNRHFSKKPVQNETNALRENYTQRKENVDEET